MGVQKTPVSLADGYVHSYLPKLVELRLEGVNENEAMCFLKRFQNCTYDKPWRSSFRKNAKTMVICRAALHQLG
jgi:hypothetical protein